LYALLDILVRDSGLWGACSTSCVLGSGGSGPRACVYGAGAGVLGTSAEVGCSAGAATAGPGASVSASGSTVAVVHCVAGAGSGVSRRLLGSQ
jgi:hypothetical protein